MTNAEQQQLAAIARQLTAESPDLARVLSDGAGRGRQRSWIWAGALTGLFSLALLIVGATTGVAALAVFSVCPVLTYLVLAAATRQSAARAGRPARPGSVAVPSDGDRSHGAGPRSRPRDERG